MMVSGGSASGLGFIMTSWFWSSRLSSEEEELEAFSRMLFSWDSCLSGDLFCSLQYEFRFPPTNWPLQISLFLLIPTASYFVSVKVLSKHSLKTKLFFYDSIVLGRLGLSLRGILTAVGVSVSVGKNNFHSTGVCELCRLLGLVRFRLSLTALDLSSKSWDLLWGTSLRLKNVWLRVGSVHINKFIFK